jgi:hypothetical protein
MSITTIVSSIKKNLGVKPQFVQEQKRPVRMAPCPGCGLEIPEGDLSAQIAHMEANHPEIIAQRLTDLREEFPDFNQESSDFELETEDMDSELVCDDYGEGDGFGEGDGD